MIDYLHNNVSKMGSVDQWTAIGVTGKDFSYEYIITNLK